MMPVDARDTFEQMTFEEIERARWAHEMPGALKRIVEAMGDLDSPLLRPGETAHFYWRPPVFTDGGIALRRGDLCEWARRVGIRDVRFCSFMWAELVSDRPCCNIDAQPFVDHLRAMLALSVLESR